MRRIALLQAAVVLLATAEALATSYSGIVSITSMQALDTTGTARVYLNFNIRPHTTGCSFDAPTQEWRLGGNAENQKNMMAVAIAARLADREVKVLFVDSYSGTASCDGGGTSGYPVVSGLILL